GLRRFPAAMPAIAVSVALLTTAAAQAPLQLTPPRGLPALKSAPKPAAKPAVNPKSRKPVQPARKEPAPEAARAALPATQPGLGREVDLAYGAYQRGLYITAFALATRRVEDKDDSKAMTLLGELYANGYGIARDDAKAAEWYRLAADHGDREAMFALAMFRLGGRAGPVNRDESTKLLAAAAKLGHAAAAYDLGLFYLE